MTFNRRGFLAAGVLTAGIAASPKSEAGVAARGRSVTDFGVQPGLEAAQTTRLQEAIDEITRSGHAVFLPGGHYATGTLNLPAACTITGPGSAAVLHGKNGGTVFKADLPGSTITLSGLAINGGATQRSGSSGRPLLALKGADVSLTHLRLMNAPGTAVQLQKCGGFLENLTVEGAGNAGLYASDTATLTVTGCQVSACRAEGMRVSSPVPRAGFAMSQNQVAACGGAGLAVDGSGVVTGNFVSQSRFGLRLGGGGGGHIVATGNLLRGCKIGIAVTASGETVLASINLINEPEDGAIRAFDGDRLVGPDLALESAESYLNLTVAGNIVR